MPGIKYNSATGHIWVRLAAPLLICALTIIWTVSPTGAQTVRNEEFNPDPIGERDTLYLEISRLGDREWSVNVSYFSDVGLFGLSIPLRFTAGLEKLLIDSTVYTGGKAEHFVYKLARADTAIQCLTMGLIAAFDPTAKPLETGTGRLATVFVHAPGEGVAPALNVDTTTTAPQNSLMYVKNSVSPANEQTKIYPAVKITTNEALSAPEEKSAAD
ncbi:MAG: hypothetical protein ACE5GA_03845 [Candidatus Zixiibacteriota bacterium]